MPPPSSRALRDSTELAGLVFAGLCALNGAFVPAVARLTSVAGRPAPGGDGDEPLRGASARWSCWWRAASSAS